MSDTQELVIQHEDCLEHFSCRKIHFSRRLTWREGDKHYFANQSTDYIRAEDHEEDADFVEDLLVCLTGADTGVRWVKLSSYTLEVNLTETYSWDSVDSAIARMCAGFGLAVTVKPGTSWTERPLGGASDPLHKIATEVSQLIRDDAAELLKGNSYVVATNILRYLNDCYGMVPRMPVK